MKKFFAVSLSVALTLCMVAAVSFAAEKNMASKESKNPVKDVVTYPGKLVVKSAEVVGDTAKSGADVVVNEAKTLGEIATGDVEKTKDAIVDPLTGTAQTAKDAVEGVANAPVDASEME
mgnify:CR=1 FL=1